MIDEMTSVEFRKRYAKLTRPTIVTVQGHMIGSYYPHIPPTLNEVIELMEAQVKPVHVAPLPAPRPFTPAPKPGHVFAPKPGKR